MPLRPFAKYQFDPADFDAYREPDSDSGAKMENIDNPDVERLHKVFSEMELHQAFDWLELNQKTFDEGTYIIDTDEAERVRQYAELRPKLIFNRHPLNRIHPLNDLLNRSNEVLAPGGYLWCHARTAMLKKEMIMRSYYFPFNYMMYTLHFIWHRCCPKLPGLRRLYYFVTGGKNRTFHRIEVLGRMCRAGFDIMDEQFLHGEFFVLGRKTRRPIWGNEPTNGPLIRLRRIGKDRKTIGVYKFRTMYSYSEYLQDYMYHHGGLAEGGKFKDDCRVSPWGRFMRKIWLDEFPMVFNWLKRDLKLIGVRPLSRQYFNLYTPEMQELRTRVKPGLIPPFYYGDAAPKTIEDVQESERRYIEAYLQSPFRTDWRYFWGTLSNILFHHRRSH